MSVELNELRDLARQAMKRTWESVTSTAPSDRKALEEALNTLYGQCKEPIPLRLPEYIYEDSIEDCMKQDEYIGPIAWRLEQGVEDLFERAKEHAQTNEVTKEWIENPMFENLSNEFKRRFNSYMSANHGNQNTVYNEEWHTSMNKLPLIDLIHFMEDHTGFVISEEERVQLNLVETVYSSTWCVHARWEFCLITERPLHLKLSDPFDDPAITLHCEDGPAFQYRNHEPEWYIRGHRVDEQIVMRPETQTIAEIDAERNEEVRRVRIERYGWERFLRETKAEVVDDRPNDIENTKEVLFRRGDMKVFMGHCPSTARIYFLEVPSNVNTCAEAQAWFWNADGSIDPSKGVRIIGRS